MITVGPLLVTYFSPRHLYLTSAGLALACALADALEDGLRIAVVDHAGLRPGAPSLDARAFALSAGSTVGMVGMVAVRTPHTLTPP